MIYFASETDAKKYITDNKLGSDYKAYKYDKGQSYYRVNLMNDPESEDLSLKYRVVRNNYYRVNITAIKALGAPTGTGVVPTDPETPIEQDSWMAAEITVKPWTAHEQNTEFFYRYESMQPISQRAQPFCRMGFRKFDTAFKC